MTPFDFRPRTRVLFGAGEFSRLGEVARELGGTKCLLVADPGMVDAGYAQEATRTLKARRMEVVAFHDFNPAPRPKWSTRARRWPLRTMIESHRRRGRREFHRLRQGDQFRGFKRRLHSRLLGLRKSVASRCCR